VTALADDARKTLPEAGWEIRNRGNASPQLERTISASRQFLTLVGLAALLVGGVGVANAVKNAISIAAATSSRVQGAGRHRPRRLSDLSDAGRRARGIGSAIGLAAGAAAAVHHRRRVRQAAAACRWCRRCIPMNSFCRSSIGLLTALAFGLWPLGRVHDVPVAALFREAVSSQWHRRAGVISP